MRREPCFREHAPGVATDCKSLPSLDQVVTVELERFVRLLGKRSFVKDSLAIILARCLEVIELEQRRQVAEKNFAVPNFCFTASLVISIWRLVTRRGHRGSLLASPSGRKSFQ